MLNVYTKDGNFPISSYIDSGLVNLVKSKPDFIIEKKDCACDTKNGIAVKTYSIFIDNSDNYVKHHETYLFDFESEEEIQTVVFFLLKSHFQTFGCTFKDGYFKRSYSEDFFYVRSKMCGCIEYELKGKPVYCLESVVVSSSKISTTIKGVLE